GRREFSPALTSVPAGLFHIARNDQPGSASSHPPVPGQGRSRTDEEETVSTTEQTQPVTTTGHQRAMVGDQRLGVIHQGGRHVFGFAATFYGIWDESAPGEPVERF